MENSAHSDKYQNTYREISVERLAYKNELSISKLTGAKSVYVSTCAGSFNDPQQKLRFQMGFYPEELMRAVYGVSDPLAGQDGSKKRTLDLSIDSDELLSFLTRLDENNLTAAQHYTSEWFKRSLDQQSIRSFYNPIVKPGREGFRPTARTKIVIDQESPNKTQFFVVRKEAQQTDLQNASIEEYEPGTMHDIEKGCRVLPIVETPGLWFAQNSFGMTLNCTHILIFPSRTPRGINAFNLGRQSNPKRALSTPEWHEDAMVADEPDF